MAAAIDRLAGPAFQEILGSAVMQGAFVFEEATKENIRTIPSKSLRRAGEPIWLTGNLARSMHSEVVESEPNRAVAAMGTDVVYARRVEFGFSGADAAGRIYNQPPNPYMRPAFDNNVEQAKAAMQRTVRELVIEEIQTLGPRGGIRKR